MATVFERVRERGPDAYSKHAGGRRWAYAVRENVVAIDGPSEADLQVSERLMTATAIITTPDPDRMGDVVIPEGGKFKNFDRNPTVFFGHQQIKFPVGKAKDPSGKLEIQVNPGQSVISTCWFSQAHQDAEIVFDLIVEGCLRGISIAFCVDRAEELPRPAREADDMRPVGFKVTEWDLTEWSFVGTPCNPYCEVISHHLKDGKVKGKSISPYLRKSLEPLAIPLRAWSPGFSFPEKNMSAPPKPHTKEADPADGKETYAVHCLKSHFGSKDLAEAKCKSMGYKSDSYAEDDKKHTYHQFPHEEATGEHETKDVEPGVQVTRCMRAKDMDDDDGGDGGYTEEGMKAWLAKVPAAPRKSLEADMAARLTKFVGLGIAAPVARRKAFGQAVRKALATPAFYKSGSSGRGDGDGGRGEPTNDPEVAGGQDTDLPHGAEWLQKSVAVDETYVNKIEHPEIKPLCEDMLTAKKKAAKDHYPDLKIGGEDPSDPDDPGNEPDNDGDGVDKYRKHINPWSKGMGKREAALVSKAAGFLKEVSEMPTAAPITETHKSAAELHHKCLKAISAVVPSDDDGKSAPPAAAKEGAINAEAMAALAVLAAQTKSIQEGIDKAAKEIGDKFYAVTGRRPA